MATTQVAGGGTLTQRSSDKDFLHHVDSWWQVLLPRLSRFLYSRGGPIVLTQVGSKLSKAF